MEHVLELEDVTKTYGDFKAVDNISLKIPRGSVYGFLGPNGAGKTTTLRMILDIIRPDSGRISVLGAGSAMSVRHRIGYLPEEKGLYKKMKVWAIIAYFASLKGMDKKSARQQAFTLLERYGLSDFANSRVETLSKGMGQKVQVLSAVAHNPELVILDEPFSGLDPVNQEVLEQLIRDMAANGQTVIFSTHIMQHAERLCGRLLLIAKGAKVFDGTVPEARALLPATVWLSSSSDIEPLRQMKQVRTITAQQPVEGRRSTMPEDTQHWQLSLDPQYDPQALLQVCFDSGIRLAHFDHHQPSLHDVFVHLVGEDAGEHVFR